MIYGFQIEVQRSSVKNTDSLLLGAISKMRTTANGTFFPYNFERRTTAFAVEPTVRDSSSTIRNKTLMMS